MRVGGKLPTTHLKKVMGTINSVMLRLNQLDLAKESIGVVVEMKDEMIHLQKEQLLEGRVKDGGKFQERYRSISYAERKHKKNSIPGLGVPDLNLTGAFSEGIRLDLLTKKTFKFTSSDSKTGQLVKKYGGVVPFFGLNPDSVGELVKEGFREKLMTRVHNVTGL